jgi:hypothetical protein
LQTGSDLGFSRIYFATEIPWTRSTEPWTTPGLSPRWTGRGRRHWARQSFVLRLLRCPRAPAKGRKRRSGTRERRREELDEGQDASGVLRGFYRGQGAPERGGRSNGGVNGFNAIEDGGEVKRGIKRGEMMAGRVTAQATSEGGAGRRGVLGGDEEKRQ